MDKSIASPRRSNWLRFSLRTLFAVIFIMAVALVIGHQQRQLSQQRQEIARLRNDNLLLVRAQQQSSQSIRVFQFQVNQPAYLRFPIEVERAMMMDGRRPLPFGFPMEIKSEIGAERKTEKLP